MTAFTAAIDLIFADPNLAADAILIPATPVRVIKRSPDDVVGFGSGDFVLGGIVFDIRTSEASDLKKGDVIALDGEFFDVIASPRADADRLVWTVEVRRQ